MENDLVRFSRAGDEFHYRWAARRCLKLIHPQSLITCLTIEGSKEKKRAGEYVIDVAEYSKNAEDNREDILYFQLKHSTKRVDIPFTLSDLKDTICGFAKRFIDLINNKNFRSIKFSIITNRVISDSFKTGISKIRNRTKAGHQFQKTIEKYTNLQGEKLCIFCDSLQLVDEEKNYIGQKLELRTEASEYLADNINSSSLDSLITLIREKALPNDSGKIIREDILKRFGVTSIRDLFPAPLEIKYPKDCIQREQHKAILKIILNTSNPVIVHAGGGVGKSVFCHQITGSLPNGSINVIYDCFGSGKYRNGSEPRHRHRDALVQIINEIALKDLCVPLIPKPTDLDDSLLRAFLLRLNIATSALQEIYPEAVLAILIDAADNAEMAAKEFAENCFANQLLRQDFPENCRLIFFCRTERISLLKPESKIRKVELHPFSETESLMHLQGIFPLAKSNDGLEFHRLTYGNPRVQANALDTQYTNISNLLGSLGPYGTTVNDQITAQLDSAISKVKDQFSISYHANIDAICVGLAILPPFIPIKILAITSKVDIPVVKSFIADLGQPLWISDDSVQFRDEPTETWFREKFSASKEHIEAYITVLKPLANEFTYVAQVLPSLLLKSENYDELIKLALSDENLPTKNPIDERNIRIYRLQFAIKAALNIKHYADAAKLAFRAGEEVAGNKRQIKILTQNVDLISSFYSLLKIQELAFRRMLKGRWDGSDNIYSASLLSSIDEHKGEARAFLRSARKWLNVYFEEHKKNNNRSWGKDKLKDSDIVEMAFAYFNLEGKENVVEFILNWKPPETIFRVTKLFIKRLVDSGNFESIDKIAKIGCRNPYFMIAVADELIKVGKFPHKEHLKQCLDLFIDEQTCIPNKSNDDFDDKIKSGIISFIEACAAQELCHNEILKIINYYIPQTPPISIGSSIPHAGRSTYLRGISLKSIILGNFNIDLEELTSTQLYEEYDYSDIAQRINDIKHVIELLIPWFLIRSSLLVLSDRNTQLDFIKAEKNHRKSSNLKYTKHNRLAFEIARVRFECIALNKSLKTDDFKSITLYPHDDYTLSLSDHLNAVRAANRLEHLSIVRDQLELSCYERLQSITDGGPEEKAEYFIDLARAVLPISPNDAKEYFNCALDAISEFGDELVERWEAVVAMAKRAADNKDSSPKMAYRFIRCAELVGDSADRENYWDRSEAIQVCSMLCPSATAGFTALSRWRDREVGHFRIQLLALAREAVSSKIINPSVGWSVSAFYSEYHVKQLAAICIETESDKKKCQHILDAAIRDFRLNEASKDSYETLNKIANKYSLNNKVLQEIILFYEHKEKADSNTNTLSNFRDTHSQKLPKIKWRDVFKDINLVKVSGLNTALDRFSALPFPKNRETFWKKIYERISANEARNFLETIIKSEKISFYDIQDSISHFPKNFHDKISVNIFWPEFIESVGDKFAYKLANHYELKLFIDNISFKNVLSYLYKGILKGLSNTYNLINASQLFCLIEVASLSVSACEATEILDFALSRFELHIDESYSDGPWAEWLLPPDNITEAFSGLIWSALGSPYSSVRWEAAHSVRRLAKLGCKCEINALIDWMERDNAGSFSNQRLPFYNFHARLYLLIALSRIAIENPEYLLKKSCLFSCYALDEIPHILFQWFASNIALSIEESFPKTYDINTITKLQEVGKSQISALKNEGSTHDSNHEYLHSIKEDAPIFDLHTGWDFENYFLKPLGKVFDVQEAEIIELVASTITDVWRIKKDPNYLNDPRSDFWDDQNHQNQRQFSYGTYPQLHDYNFYIAYHAMFVVAGKLLLEQPIVHQHDSYEDPWSEWIHKHLLTRSDGRWLADRRDPTPLDINFSDLHTTLDDSHQEIDLDELLNALIFKKNGKTWVNVRTYWNKREYSVTKSCSISSALVNRMTSQSLLNALTTCNDYRDFKLPDYKEHRMEFSDFPFELEGWIVSKSDEINELDSSDPHSGDIIYPTYEIGLSICEKLRLSIDTDCRKWMMPNSNEESLLCETWNFCESKNSEWPHKQGIRICSSLDLLTALCSIFDKDLIIKVVITNRLKSSYHQDKKSNAKEYSRMYIFSADGKLRDTGTSYRFR